MKTRQLPAGLVDNNIEVFDHDGTLKATYQGKVVGFFDLPETIINKFLDKLIENEEAWKEFRRQGMKDQGEMLREYVYCNFGGWDLTPDYENGNFNAEYWACPKRGKCPYGEKICPKLQAKNGKLSRREMDVIRLVARGLQVKEIAPRLYISKGTVRKHIARIHAKLMANNNVEVANFAHDNNLL